MTEQAKTSTFTIDHTKCDPSTWTVSDWQRLVEYVRTGSLQAAAALSRKGMKLERSDFELPAGETVEHLGWAFPGDEEDLAETLEDLIDDDDPVEVVQVYRGRTMHAVKYWIDDGGTEVEIFETAEQAAEFAASLKDAPAAMDNEEDADRAPERPATAVMADSYSSDQDGA